MTATTKNLGLVKAIFDGTTPPSNIQALWYDTNSGVNKQKYYDVISGLWVELAATPSVDYTRFDTWRTKVRSTAFSNPGLIPSLLNGQRFIVGIGATGDWLGHDNEIATRVGSTWEFETPITNWAVLNDAQLGFIYIWNQNTTSWDAFNLTTEGDIQSNGGVPFTADQSMGGFKLTDIADPTNPGDAVNLSFLQDALLNGGYIPLSGTTVGNNVSGNVLFGNSVSLSNAAANAFVTFSSGVVKLRSSGNSKVEVNQFGIIVGSTSIASQTNGTNNVIFGTATGATFVNNPSNNLIGLSGAGSVALDASSNNVIFSVNTGSKAFTNSSRNFIIGQTTGTSTFISSNDNFQGGIHSSAVYVSGSGQNFLWGATTSTTFDGLRNVLFGNGSAYDIEGDENFFKIRGASLSVSGSGDNTIIGLTGASTFVIDTNQMFVHGDFQGATFDTITQSHFMGVMTSGAFTDNIYSNYFGYFDSSIISNNAYTTVLGKWSSSSIDTTVTSLLAGSGAFTTISGSSHTITGLVDNMTLSGSYQFVTNKATNSQVSGSHNALFGDNSTITITGTRNFVHNTDNVGSTITGSNNFIGGGKNVSVATNDNIIFNSELVSIVTGGQNFIYSYLPSGSITSTGSFFINLGGPLSGVYDYGETSSSAFIGNINGGGIIGFQNYGLGQIDLSTDIITTANNTYLGVVSAITDNPSESGNVFINVNTITPDRSDTIYVPNITFKDNSGSGFFGNISTTTLTATRTYVLPNASGTLALLSDIPGGVGATWQQVSNGSGEFNLIANPLFGSDDLINFIVQTGGVTMSIPTTATHNVFVGNFPLPPSLDSASDNNVAIGTINDATFGDNNTLFGNIDATDVDKFISSSLIGIVSNLTIPTTATRIQLLGSLSNSTFGAALADVTFIGTNSSITATGGNNTYVNSNAVTGTATGVTALNVNTFDIKTSNSVYVNRLSFYQTGTAFEVIFSKTTLTNDRTILLPDQSGTVALLSDIPVISGFVTLTGVETLTNKTLTAPIITDPIINVGSDATGDMYYRNSGGNFTRLAVGTVGQILNSTGTLPAWTYVAKDAANVSSFDFNNRDWFDDTGIQSGNHGSRSLLNSSASVTLNWEFNSLYKSGFVISLDWENKVQYGNWTIDTGNLLFSDTKGIDVTNPGDTLNVGQNSGVAVLGKTTGAFVYADNTNDLISLGNLNLDSYGFGFGTHIWKSANTTILTANGTSITGGVKLLLNADAVDALGAVTLQQMTTAIASSSSLQQGYNASSNLFPTAANTSPVVGTVTKGMQWYITTGGTLGGTAVEIGDTVTALTNSPGQTAANWLIVEHNFGFTPISNVLNSARILVGNGSNIATSVSMSGDASIANTGAVIVSKIGGKNIVLGGDVTFSGAFNTTFTVTGTTAVTLPTSGTLATLTDLAGYLPLTLAANKTVNINGNLLLFTDGANTKWHVTDNLFYDNSNVESLDLVNRFLKNSAGGVMLQYGSSATGLVIGNVGSVFGARLKNTNLTANRDFQFPNNAGTFVTTGDTGTVTNTMLAGSIAYSKLILTGSIVNADIVDVAWSKITGTPTTVAGYGIADAVTLTGIQTLTNKTLTSPIISTISNTGTLTLPTSTDTLVGKATTDTFTNKTYDTAGTGNVFKINGTTISSNTGSGSVNVLQTSPILITPALGVATATSINSLTITTSTGTLTITNLKTLSVSNTLTFTGTDGSSVAFGAGGTVAYVGLANTWTSGIKQTFAPSATTAGLNVGSVAGAPSGLANGDVWYDSTADLLKARINGTTTTLATGGTVTTVSVVTANGVSGSVATATTTPAITLTLGAITPTSVNGLTISTSNGTLTIVNGSSLITAGAFTTTLTSTATTNVTLPTTGTLATLAGNETFTNKTLTSPTINGGTHTSVTSFSLRDTSAAFDVTFVATSSTPLAAGRTLTLDMVNAARTIKLTGNLTLAADFITSGANSLTLTTTGSTNVTLPTSGTLVNSTVTTLSSLVSVGTITTGVWNGTIVTGTFGGTGVNNGASTITLGGSFATSGAFTTTLTVSANTNVTLPTTGTLATLAGSEALTNKTINGLTVTSSTGTLTVTNLKTLAVSNTLTFTGTDGSSVAFGAGGTVAYVGLANTWSSGIKQTFSPSATTAGINVGSVSGDPSAPANGDLWYDSTGNLLRARVNGSTISLGSGSGTVTTVSVVTANGVSGSVATATTTPAITITLGAITPTTVNKVTITAPTTSATLTLIDGSSLITAGAFATTLTATGTTNVTLPTTGTLVNSAVTTLSSLVSIGTVTTGTWNATVITGQFGGTGVANTGKTITLGGNMTTSGAFAVTFTLTNTTSVTLPTTGTLVNDAVTTLASLVSVSTITTGTWNATVIAGQYGGTGVANTGKTITLGGNLTTSGAFAATLTLTATTNVTLPTTGLLMADADLPIQSQVRSFKSTLVRGNTNLILTSGTAYAVFIGTTKIVMTPKKIRFRVSVAGVGAQTAEIGLFSTPNPPNSAAQTLTKLVATGTVDALTGTGVIVGNTADFATSVPAGTNLWAVVRVAMATTQPDMGITGTVGRDYGFGRILTLAGASALTGITTLAGTIPADGDNQAPGLEISLD